MHPDGSQKAVGIAEMTSDSQTEFEINSRKTALKPERELTAKQEEDIIKAV